MKYRELIQFDPIESVVQLPDADEVEAARRLVQTYVVGDQMAERLRGLAIPQLRFDEAADNRGLLVVGDYGTGKSHLMSVISAVAEHREMVDQLDAGIREAMEPIAGQFKVARTVMGATRMDLRTFVCSTLENALDEWGVDGGFRFPPPEEIPNHRAAFEDMMTAFDRRCPGKGLLLVVDELLDYLRSRDDQELVRDLSFLREVGEVCKDLRFRFIAGVQEAIFDSDRFSHVADSVRRVQDRFEQLRIAREDIKHVVAERLLRKSGEQRERVAGHLAPFTKFYGRMNERLDDFVRLFPVHPDFIDIFERLAVVEKRQVLKTLSSTMAARLDHEVPADQPGLIAYDQFWATLRDSPTFRAVPEVREVMECSEVLESRIASAFTRPHYSALALRIVHALSVHRLSHRDIHSALGATAEELRDQLCLHQPGIEDMGSDEPDEDLRGLVETVLREIHKTVSGQFITQNLANGQYYLDLKKTEDLDAKIEQRAETLDSVQLNRHYYKALLQIMECTDKDSHVTGYQIWQHQLEWRERRASRLGYLFFGAPNERSTAVPPRDFYLYFLPLHETRHFKDERRADEVFFRLSGIDEDFGRALERRAAAVDLASRASGNTKEVYTQKADGFLKELTEWMRERSATAFQVTHQGTERPFAGWIVDGRDASGATGTVRDAVNTVASNALAAHFAEQAPQYPTFRDYQTVENRPNAVIGALQWIEGSKKTRAAARVLDSLRLLDGERLDPKRSPYARHIMEALEKKDSGKVLNRAELIETIDGVEYLAPGFFRLEPEWVVVLLAALVYAGDLVVAVPGKKYDSSDLAAIAASRVHDLADFKHLERPKEWNLPGMTALFEMLQLAPGLARQVTVGEHSPVRELQNRIEQAVQQLLEVATKLREGISFWGEPILSEEEAGAVAQRLDRAQEFLESVRRFDTPGKFKNFTRDSEEVHRLAAGLKDLSAVRNLLEISHGDLGQLASYCATAKALLPEGHQWIADADAARQDVLASLRDRNKWDDGSFRRQSGDQLRDLRRKYVEEYLRLHRRARLERTEDDRKKHLLRDERFVQLDKLGRIELLSAQQPADLRNRLLDLESCFGLTKRELQARADCSRCGFQPSDHKTPAPVMEHLSAIDRDLDRVLLEWTAALLENLQDSVANEQVELLGTQQRQLVEAFLEARALPDPLSDEFVKVVCEALSGLTKVVLTRDGVSAALARGGLPATPEEMKRRFADHLDEETGGHDPGKVRIVIEGSD